MAEKIDSTAQGPTTQEPTDGSFRAVKFRFWWALLGMLIVVAAGIFTTVQPLDPQPLKPRASRSWLERLWYPVESNPALRLPRPPNNLAAVSFASDGQRGLVVGSGGTILSTGDGGTSWKATDSGASNTLRSVHLDAGGTNAWAVGTRGIILVSHDGGESWKQQSSGTTARLNAVHFLEGASRGWAVGDDRTILVTSDGGQKWDRQETVAAPRPVVQQPNQSKKEQGPVRKSASTTAAQPRPNLFAVDFSADGTRGWAVGYDGVILSTRNGGETWTEQRSPRGYTLLSVRFAPDGQRGVASGYGTVIVTTDGGARWEAKPAPGADDDSVWFTAIELAADDRRLWVARNDGSIFGTTDGGATWIRQESGILGWLSALRIDAKGQRGWAVGSGGSIMTTDDGGRNWVTRASSKTSLLKAVHLDATGQFGWAVGGAGRVLATSDAGTHWERQNGGTERSLNGLKVLADGRRAWAVGDGGTIISTSDGGRHWTSLQSGTPFALNAVDFNSDGQRGWAAGDAIVMRTRDGGKSWELWEVEGGPSLNSIHFEPSGVRGWMVGSNGSLLATQDGGRAWQRSELDASEELFDVNFDDAGERGLIVGSAGALFTTSDSGASWTRKDSGTTADLTVIHRSSDGTLRIAASNGAILTSRDGGETRPRAESNVGSGLLGLSFADDGRTGWAVGYPPSLLKAVPTTKDDGVWSPVDLPLGNQRYPAPWFWIASGIALAFLALSLRPARAISTEGVEAIAASDAPIADFERDRLQFGPLARGISRFLRNASTQPPLTIAISGDWGSGKSTLMELVCTDLRRYGTRPVWFNAWHHQTEEHLLAALLNEIRAKGLPSIGTYDGVLFRLRLLAIRSKKHAALTFLLALAAVALAIYLVSHDFSEWTILWNDINNAAARLTGEQAAHGTQPAIAWADAAHLLPQLLTGSAALFSLFRALKAFKIDPAVLLASTAENFKLKDANAQTSFRSRFAEQFEEVTRALPRTMVIVIDDLDRCQPQTVLTVMESINFLVSSGKCFVLFGMATRRVQAALSLTFREVAGELQLLEESDAVRPPPPDKEAAERERRLAYARDYLEKLINLEIVVPKRADIPPHLLVETVRPKPQDLFSAVIAQFAERGPAWAAAVGLLAAVLFGYLFSPPDEAASKVPVAKPAVVAPAPAPADPQRPDGPPGAVVRDAPLPDANRVVPQMQKGAAVAVDRWTVAAVIAFLGVLLAAGVTYWLRVQSNAVTDSPRYREALRIWMPVVQRYRGTPRAIKRFGNRLRYLAMLQHDTKYDETGFDELRRRMAGLGAWLRPRRQGDTQPAHAVAGTGNKDAIDERLLVAFASLQEVYGPYWQARAQFKYPGTADLEDVIQAAIASSTSEASWPPDDRSIGAFEQLLKGIRTAEAK